MRHLTADPPIIARGPSDRPRFAPMLFQHPVCGDVRHAFIARGDDYRRLPVCRDAPGRRPLVDRIGVRSDGLRQGLPGGPCVDQFFDGVFLCHARHNGRFFQWTQGKIRWKYIQWLFFLEWCV